MHQLEPENMSVTGLNLFQQLSHLTRIANASFDTTLSEDEVQFGGFIICYRDDELSLRCLSNLLIMEFFLMPLPLGIRDIQFYPGLQR